jgi:hypothetical protein
MRHLLAAALVVTVGVIAFAAAPAPPAAPLPAPPIMPPTGVTHPFLCADYGSAKVRVVSAEGKVTWEIAAPGCQDVWLLPSGNYLFSHTRGAREVTPDAEKKTVWEYVAPAGTEVHTCQPLPDGSVLICECGTSRLIEVGRDGKVRKEIKIETTTKNTHGQFRIARKLANGNYLVSLTGENLVREFDGAGKVLRTIKVPGNPYEALRLPSGNTLIACGDGHKLIEVDPQDKVVWGIDENEIPGHPLRFVAGLQRLPNGNTVVCNWGGHGRIGQQPQIFEVTPDKKVVWQVNDWATFKTISGIMLLDVKGDVTKGEILR